MLSCSCRNGLDPPAAVVAAAIAPIPVSELLGAEYFAHRHAEAVFGASTEALREGEHLLATPIGHLLKISFYLM